MATPRSLAFAALVDACRLWLETDSSGALTAEDLDWGSFSQQAFVHNLEPLLHHLRAEKLLTRPDIPPAICDRWESAYFENFVFNSRSLEVVRPFCDACARSQLAISFIKGPVIAARTFGDPALRIMVDFDILCREHDLPSLIRLARDVGFVDGEETAVYHCSLRHRQHAILLELHFRLYDFLPQPAAALAEVLDASAPLDLGDFAIPAPPPHLETAVEIAHLVNHDLAVNLRSLLDVAAGLRKLPSVNALSASLSHWNLGPEAAVIGRLLGRLFGFPVQLAEEPCPPYADAVVEAALERVTYAERESQPALAELAARPGISAKISYLSRLLGSSSRRLDALQGDSGNPRGSFRLTHLGQTFRRGWKKLVGAGLASVHTPSIKRELYRRVAQERTRASADSSR